MVRTESKVYPVSDGQPRRVVRSRARGWRMPPNTVYVGRPGKWGNPRTSRRIWQAKTWRAGVERIKLVTLKYSYGPRMLMTLRLS